MATGSRLSAIGDTSTRTGRWSASSWRHCAPRHPSVSHLNQLPSGRQCPSPLPRQCPPCSSVASCVTRQPIGRLTDCTFACQCGTSRGGRTPQTSITWQCPRSRLIQFCSFTTRRVAQSRVHLMSLFHVGACDSPAPFHSSAPDPSSSSGPFMFFSELLPLHCLLHQHEHSHLFSHLPNGCLSNTACISLSSASSPKRQHVQMYTHLSWLQSADRVHRQAPLQPPCHPG